MLKPHGILPRAYHITDGPYALFLYTEKSWNIAAQDLAGAVEVIARLFAIREKKALVFCLIDGKDGIKVADGGLDYATAGMGVEIA